MVFEWMQGGDLFSHITRNINQELSPFETVKPVITLTQIRLIALQITRALAFLERYGIMHCDLKPENILIEDVKAMKVKLSDMGSSIFMSD
jgi:serine/threonine protein kinase